jgi:hypothetical protein
VCAPGSFVFVLAFRPSDEKKPDEGLLDFGDKINRAEDADESDALGDDWEVDNGDGCARAGYGRAGGPWGELVSAAAR